MTNGTLDQRKKSLSEDIEGLRIKFNRLKVRHEFTYYFLIGLGIGLSLLAAILGLFDLGIIAGIMALIVGAAVSFESSFKFGEKWDFYRILVNECENLKIALKYRVYTDKNFDLLVNKFQVVVNASAKSLPRGKGMQEVKKLYENLDREGILDVPEVEDKEKRAFV